MSTAALGQTTVCSRAGCVSPYISPRYKTQLFYTQSSLKMGCPPTSLRLAVPWAPASLGGTDKGGGMTDAPHARRQIEMGRGEKESLKGKKMSVHTHPCTQRQARQREGGERKARAGGEDPRRQARAVRSGTARCSGEPPAPELHLRTSILTPAPWINIYRARLSITSVSTRLTSILATKSAPMPCLPREPL